ncbi:MAG: AbrB/MazE/SpoVT family DNA-binding domain-containing protein [Proteobacteria bacterium]|nr:AbrB/MazE/SpoVT family DNA-binding domain-containing protein [Pseudomonadota bacterium]
MKTKAQKWGNSLAVRVPKGIVEQSGIREGDALNIEVADESIVLMPQRRGYRLENLLKDIRKDNLHDEADFGAPRGREML